MQPQLPPAPVQWAQEQLAKFGPIGATKLVVTPRLAAVIPAVVGSIATAPIITWPWDCWVIAMYGQERLGTTAKFAQTEVNVQFPGDEFLVTNGAGADFAPMLATFGPNVNWLPMTRRVVKNDVWTVSYRNMDPTPGTADPTTLFGCIRDADLATVAAAMKASRGLK